MRLSLKEYCDILAKHPHLKPDDEKHVVGNIIQAGIAESDGRPTLVSDEAQARRSQKRGGQSDTRIRLRIHFVSFSRRSVFQDGDNYQASLKPIRDAICSHIGVDDGSPYLDFEYSQVRSRGSEAVIIRMELIP